MSRETVHIVLFRGVGGKTQLPVKPLRAALDKAGFKGVRTYINSGNAVLRSADGPDRIAAEVSRIVARAFGFEKSVIIRDRAEWKALIDANPFARAVSAPTTLHAFALETVPDDAAVDALRDKATGTERFAIVGRTLYLHAPDGLGRSKFAPKIETTLKVAMTARNWNTVLKLGELADEVEAG